jgi:ABC-type multidrug transport system fused ATPase/permease subunit
MSSIPTLTLTQSYKELLGPFKFKALVTICLIALAGAFEGMALVALIPVLGSLNSSSTAAAPSGKLLSLLEMFHLSSDQLLYIAISLFALLGLLASSFRLIADSSLLKVRTGIEETLQKRMSSALLSMEWSRFLSLRLGDLSKSILAEGFKISLGCHYFLEGIGALCVVILLFSLSLLIAPDLTLSTAAFGVVGAGVYYLVAKRSRRHSNKLSGIQSEIGDKVGEIFNNLKFYRASGSTDLAEKSAHRAFEQYRHSLFWAFEYGYIMRFIFETGAVFFVSGFLVVNIFVFQKPLPSLLIFLALFYRLAPRLLKTQEAFFHAKTYLSWYTSLRERLLYAEGHRALVGGVGSPSYQQVLSLEGVTFSYPESSVPALNHISLSVKQGECVALVGASGSGKSTLLDIILGLLEPSKGEVLVDNESLITQVNREKWRHQIGVVTQESPVFYGSILENIAWGSPSPDREAAEEAARMAHAWEFIERLPGGLDALVGEKGGKLSGGQRQRLAIARALYRKPALLVLDEATSALDSESEQAVQAALEQLRGKLAMIMVAHRLKTVRFADRILVFEQGAIVEQGSWNQLLDSRNGLFQRLASAQELHAA